MTEARNPLIRTRDDFGRATTRDYPVTPLKLTTSAQTALTAGASEVLLVQNLLLSNGTAGAVTATVHVVPSGGAVADGNIVLHALSIPANGQVTIISAIAIPPGGTLRALAAANDAIRLSGIAHAVL